MKMCTVLFAIATLLLSGASVAEAKTGFFATGKCDDDRIVSFSVQHMNSVSARPTTLHILGSSGDNAKNKDQSIRAGVLLAQMDAEEKAGAGGWMSSIWNVFTSSGVGHIGFPKMIISTMVLAPTHGNKRLSNTDDAHELATQHLLYLHEQVITLSDLKKSNEAFATGDKDKLVFPFGNLVPVSFFDEVSEFRHGLPEVEVQGCDISYYFDYWYKEGIERNPAAVYPEPWHSNPVSLEAKHGDGN